MRPCHPIGVLALLVCLTGCAASNRTSIPPADTRRAYVIEHSLSRSDAFNAIELAPAGEYKDWTAVVKLRQPETGTLLARPNVRYQAGGKMGATMWAAYTLTVKVTARFVARFVARARIANCQWCREDGRGDRN